MADLWAAALLAGVRGCAVWVGSWLGGTLGRAEPDIRRRLWQGMVTQVRLRCSSKSIMPTWQKNSSAHPLTPGSWYEGEPATNGCRGAGGRTKISQ